MSSGASVALSVAVAGGLLLVWGGDFAVARFAGEGTSFRGVGEAESRAARRMGPVREQLLSRRTHSTYIVPTMHPAEASDEVPT